MEAIFTTASTGMSAQKTRLSTIASNLANANHVGTTPETTYRAKLPVFETIYTNLAGNQAGQAKVNMGVRVQDIVEDQTQMQREYRPGHPKADKGGFVYLSNVNATEEMVNMISASRAYQTNVEIMNTSKQLILRTLSILNK